MGWGDFAVLLVLLNCLTESTFPSPSSNSNRIQPIIIINKKILQILGGGGRDSVGGGGGGGGGERSQGHPPSPSSL